MVVLGGANSDYLVRGESLPKPGETVDGCEFLEAPGGKGANQAVAAARLGARVAFIGKFGKDRRGDVLLRSLRAEGIDTRFVFRDSRAPTGAALVMVDKTGEKQIHSAPGANQRLTLSELSRAAGLIRSARVLLMQFEVPMPVVLAAAKFARSAGTRVVLDPAPPRRAPRKLLSLVDVIRPNASEAKALTGIEVKDRASARKAAGRLFRCGVRVVAIQAGGEGDLIIWEELRTGTSAVRELSLPKIKVKTVDATGAGDAFGGGLAVAVGKRQPWSVAGPFASAAAALATTKFGAQPAMPRLQDVLRLMKKAGFRKEARRMKVFKR